MAEEQALILRASRYQDASKIITYFSLEGGLRTGFARGATARDNRFGASLEPLTLCRISGRSSGSQGLHRIHHADIIDSYRRIHGDFNRLAWAGMIVRFLLGLLPPGHPEASLFLKTISSLSSLDAGKDQSSLLWLLYAREGLAILGYRPSPPRCIRCHRDSPQETIFFFPGDGTVLCAQCRKNQGGGGVGISWEILAWVSGTSPDGELDSKDQVETAVFLDRLISEHHPRWIPTESITFLPEREVPISEYKKVNTDRGGDEEKWPP